VILIGTLAWIEFLRDTGSPVCNRVDALLAEDMAICDAVRMKYLQEHATSNTCISSVDF
jgi:hypothetical protein